MKYAVDAGITPGNVFNKPSTKPQLWNLFIIIITFIAYIMAAIAQQEISMLMLKECRWL